MKIQETNLTVVEKNATNLYFDIETMTIEAIEKELSRTQYQNKLSVIVNDEKYYNGISEQSQDQLARNYIDTEIALAKKSGDFVPISSLGYDLLFDGIVNDTLRMNNTMISTAGYQYEKMANVILTDVANGVISINDVGREYKKMTKYNPIHTLVDSSGKNWRVDHYMKMYVCSEHNNICKKMREEYMKENNLSFYVVSHHTHRAPRVGCKSGDGQLVCKNGAQEFEQLDGTTIRAISESTANVGAAAGLFGINCTHTAVVVVEGYSQIK